MKKRTLLTLAMLCLLALPGCAEKKKPAPAIPAFPQVPHAAMQTGAGPGALQRTGERPYAVSGGWGYTQQNAIVLSIPAGKQKRHYNNTIPQESQLVRLRNEMEFASSPAQGQRHLVVDHGKVARTVCTRNGKMYAVWRAQMHVIAERTAPALYRELAAKPVKERVTSASRAISRPVQREYWFDVTDTFNAKHTKKQK